MFIHDALTRDSPKIRLLQVSPRTKQGAVCCDVTTYDCQGDVPDYVALSYTWGPEVPTRCLILNGKRFPVRENLYLFLEHAIKLGLSSEYLWIDAICINQSDKTERMHQVSRMAQIYYEARMVLVWLGPSQMGSDRAMAGISKLDPAADLEKKISVLCSLDLQSLHALCTRAYWHRLWIFQELMLARRITLACGSRTVSWKRFLLAVHGSQNILSGQDLQVSRANLFQSLWASPSTAIARQLVDKTKTKSLFDLIIGTSHLCCADIYDKAYALLGVAKAGDQALQPNYSRPLSHVVNDILRNHHRINPPKILAEVEGQCQRLSEIFKMNITNVCDHENDNDCQTLIEKPDVTTYENFPLALPGSSVSLWWALIYCHEQVEQLLRQSSISEVHDDATGDFFASQLLHAANASNKLVLDLLLGRNWIGKHLTATPRMDLYLHQAIRSKQATLVRFLLEKTSISVNKRDENGDTALALACSLSGTAEIVKDLLSTWSNHLNTTNKQGDSPLHLALRSGNSTAVEQLVKRTSLDIGQLNNAGETPLSIAQARNDPALFEALTSHGSLSERGGMHRGGTSLFLATVQIGSISTLRTILSHLPNSVVDTVDTTFETALHLAIVRGEPSIFQLLLHSNDIRVNASDHMGRTALHYAVKTPKGNRTHPDIFTWLVEDPRTDLSSANRYGETALHMAAESGEAWMVKKLLERVDADGKIMDVNKRDDENKTALYTAVCQGHREVVETLVACRAVRLDVKGGAFNKTALIVALEWGRSNIVKVIQREQLKRMMM